VTPGALVVRPGGVTRELSGVREIVQTDRNVTVVTTRLVPPWFNISLAVSDGTTSAQVSTWIGARASLRAALNGAGFDVRETATWFSRANEEAAQGRARPSGAQLPIPRWAIAVSVVLGAAVAVLVVSHAPAFVALAVAAALISLAPLTRR
jgi:hypothetical protein